MDSRELANRVADSFDGEAPTVVLPDGSRGVLVHTIVLKVLDVLKEEGYLDVEPIREHRWAMGECLDCLTSEHGNRAGLPCPG